MITPVFTKGMIIPLDGGAKQIVFQWNPYEMHLVKDIKWKGQHVAGREQPIYQYGCGEAQILSFSIEVSRDNNSDFFVKGMFDDMLELCKPLVKGSGIDRPPLVQVILGAAVNMRGFLDNVHIRHGSHRGQQFHFTYLATPDLLLPKDGHVIVKFIEYK